MQKNKEKANPSNSPSSTTIDQVVEEKVRSAIEKQVAGLSVSREEFFAGPAPPPEFAERYEKLLPGFMARTMAIAEAEQSNRWQAIKRRDFFDFLRVLAGMGGAVGITAFLVWIGYKLITGGHEIMGLVSLVAAVVPFLTTVFLGRKPDKETKGSKS